MQAFARLAASVWKHVRHWIFPILLWQLVLPDIAAAQSYELNSNDPQIARSLAAMEEGAAADEADDLALAERKYREALEIRVAVLGPLHWASGNAHLQLALVLDRTDRTDEAMEAFESAIAAYRASRPELLATSLDDYSRALEGARRYPEAEAARRQSLEALGYSDFTPTDREELQVDWEMRLGTILRWQGKHADAAPLLKAYLDRFDSGSDEDAYEYSETLFDLAYALAETDRPDEATALYQRVIEAYRKRGDLNEGILVASLLNQTNLLENAGELEAAIGLMEERIGYCMQLADNPAEIAMDIMRLANLHNRSGRLDLAEAQLRRALGQYETVDPPLRLRRLSELVKWAYDVGLPALAEDIARARLELASQVGDLAQRADALTALANLFLDLGRPADAAPLIGRAETILADTDPSLALQRGVMHFVRGRGLATSDPDRAETALLAAIAEFSGLEGGLKANEAVSRGLLARIYLSQARHAEALESFDACTALFRQYAPGYRGDIVLCQTGGAEALAGMGDVDAAIARFLFVLPLMQSELSDRSPVLIDRLGVLGDFYAMRAASIPQARHWYRDAARRIQALTARQATDVEASRFAKRFGRVYQSLVAADWRLAQAGTDGTFSLRTEGQPTKH